MSFLVPALLLALLSGGLSYPSKLADSFADPPSSARPRVWWHWIDGNVTREGIRSDLEWMHSVGIAGFTQFDAALGGRQVVPEPVHYMDGRWKDCFSYAMHLADSLGMEASVASCPGWSSTGGPWVAPEQAMKKLVWRYVEVSGTRRKTLIEFPDIPDVPGSWQDIPDGQYKGKDACWTTDIAVVAVRLPEAETNVLEGALVSSSGGSFALDLLTDGKYAEAEYLPVSGNGFSWIQYELPEPRTARSLSLCTETRRWRFRANPAEYHWWLDASEDGICWKEVAAIPDSSIPAVTVDFPAVTARFFRIRTRFDGGRKECPVREFRLFSTLRVQHAEDKAGYCSPHDLHEFMTPPSPDAIIHGDVLVLHKGDFSGRLKWKVPSGRWRIYRFGASLTGKINHPAPDSATGLEVDKLDKKAWKDFFDTYIEMYKDASGGYFGNKGLQYILTDSYEAEHENWTAAMPAEFEKRCGYSLFSWLPVIAGEILGSSDESERFLADWRMTLGDLFADNYRALGDIVRSHGLAGRYTEAHESGRTFVGDGMDIKAEADVPMSAFWMPVRSDQRTMPVADIRESASVAHIWGQNVVACESFTADGRGGDIPSAYGFSPADLKYTADFAFSNGMNRVFIHESAHQPSDELIPGFTLGFYGQWFNRHETWAPMARAWIDYLARTSFMLQQGKSVADILVYYGEDNCVTGLYGHKLPDALPEGFAFDFINPRGLLNAVHPENGRIVSISGSSWKVLWLGEGCTRMSVDVLRRLAGFADAGILICGTVPQEPLGLRDDPDEWKRLRDSIWFCNRMNVSREQPGSVLQSCGVDPDFESSAVGLRYVHRHLDDGTEIYWIWNTGGASLSADLDFRSGGRSAWVFNAESGSVTQIPCKSFGSRTRVRMDLLCDDAFFVVLSPEESQDLSFPDVSGAEETIHICGPWTVKFQQGRGAPESIVLDNLSSLSLSDIPGVRYFSGIATYSTTFTLKGKNVPGSGGLSLNLGDVANVAEVLLNGKLLGTVWRSPFVIRGDVLSGALKPGENHLEVRVANLWPNRLIGDMQPGAGKVCTMVGYPFYKASDPLRPSGLIGPVTLTFPGTE